MASRELLNTTMSRTREGDQRLGEVPIHVCHVSVSLNTGGLERILAGISQTSDRSRYKHAFVALREEGRFAEEIRQTGASVVTMKCKNRIAMIGELRNYFRSRKVDIVHTHNTFPHLYGTLAARWAKVPIVVNTRHGQRAGHGWKSRFLFRMASRWVNRIVAVSDDAANLCVQADGLSKSKVTRIWNGIDASQFSFRGPSADPIAVTVGRLVPEKDLATLIRAISLASGSIPNLRLKIVGEGPSRPELERLTRELGMESQIDFVGEIRDVSTSLEKSGFYVSSSLTEGISLTLLEAMSVGLPVIATRVGGNPEVVAEPETGLLVEASNPQALAGAIVSLCRRSDRWYEMGVAARKRVVDSFGVERMVEGYQELYQSLLDERKL